MSFANNQAVIALFNSQNNPMKKGIFLWMFYHGEMALNKDESSMFSLGTHRIILSANSYLIDDIAEEQRNKIL